MSPGIGHPVVYGYEDPAPVVAMLESVARVLERQPADVLALGEVRRSGRALATLLDQQFGDRAPELSVIVPAFNEERYIAATLQAVEASARLVAEVGGEVEVIVVDDQSTDATAALAESPADRVVTGPGGTIGGARNAGAAVARGRTLVFVDADSWIEPEVLPAIRAAADAGAVAGSIRATYRSARPAVQLLLRFWDWYAPRHDITQGVCQFFDRAVFEAAGGYDTGLRMAEDTDLYHRVQRQHGPQAVCKITDAAVYPSMRRYDQVSAARLWWQMNPITTRWFRRSARLWRDWYVDPPR